LVDMTMVDRLTITYLVLQKDFDRLRPTSTSTCCKLGGLFHRHRLAYATNGITTQRNHNVAEHYHDSLLNVLDVGRLN